MAAHQRGRLHDATVELVAEHGYDAVTVAMLTSRARVSKRDFYKHFSGKEECFLASYDILVSDSLRGVLAAAEGEEDWRERLRLGFLAFAGQIAGNPEAARLALVEVFAAGAIAVERMLSTNRSFEALVAENLARAEEPIQLPPLVVKGIVAGCGRAARARLLPAWSRRSALDGSELMEWVLSLCDDSVGGLVGIEAGPPLPATVTGAPFGDVPPGDERALIETATLRLASREGYAMLTAPRIRAAAGVSKRSFDSHYTGVPDCFRATLETLSGRALGRAEPFYLAADTWAIGVHRMIVSLCHGLAHDPAFATLAFLEVFSPGSEVVQWRSEMTTRLAAALRDRAPRDRRPTMLAAEASVGAMWGVIHHLVATGRGAQLPAAAPILSYLALAPALGASAAVDAIVADSQIGTPCADRLHPSPAG